MSKINKILNNIGQYLINSHLQGYELSIDPEFNELINKDNTLILNSNTTSNINSNGKVETNLSLLICNIKTDNYKEESDKLKNFQEDLMLYFNDKKHLTNMNEDIVKVDKWFISK
jgi:hypothetical protein